LTNRDCDGRTGGAELARIGDEIGDDLAKIGEVDIHMEIGRAIQCEPPVRTLVRKVLQRLLED
jgi:hypothetical protein